MPGQHLLWLGLVAPRYSDPRCNRLCPDGSTRDQESFFKVLPTCESACAQQFDNTVVSGRKRKRKRKRKRMRERERERARMKKRMRERETESEDEKEKERERERESEREGVLAVHS